MEVAALRDAVDVARVARGEATPEDAVRAAETELKRIFDKWK